MKASLTWMNEYVPVDMNRPAQELADELTQAGIPVEEVEMVDPGLKKIFTGKIIEITKHPDADKLQVCQVACLDTDGTPITKQIITAATNVRVGQIVPVAYHKSRLADGTEIKKGKLRGLPSEGMFCSVAELGISKELVVPEEAEGIYILPADTPIGMDIRDVLMMNDTVYEFELTPNRADCFSMVGLSREFAVLTNQKAVLPEITVDENGEAIDGKVQVTIADGDLCSRFAARLVTGVTVAPSPMWLQNRLRNSGIRPINNVVDVTNYVMLELGQPMHAYDYAHVKGHSLTARRANEGEVLKTLDGTDRELTTDMLVIADEQRAVGVAGVMGGYDSEVTNTTTDVLLEAAVFNGASIRRTARALGMRSEASGRFERGVNPEYSIMATGTNLAGERVGEPSGIYADGVSYYYNMTSECLAFTTKYSDVTNAATENADANWPFLRYADVKLIYAEAENELGHPEEAIIHLNDVRRRSNAAEASLTGNGALDTQEKMRSAIIEERAKEFACEADRRWDLIRWGIYLDAMNAIGTNEDSNGNKTRTERNLLFPIPNSEFNTNHAITENNPGWA